MKTVLHITGMGYSGSSLLNLLLDAQPRIRGLGEALWLTMSHESVQCHHCRCLTSERRMRGVIDQSRFYGSIFDFYGDCDVLVDSSKCLDDSVKLHPHEQGIEHRVVLLSKTPAEFAYSFLRREPEPLAVCLVVESWVQIYRKALADTKALGLECHTVTYCGLATDPAETVRELCEWIGVDVDPDTSPWESDSHIIAGNPIVSAAASGDAGSFTGGKYSGKFRQIFYDDAWRRDVEFVTECERVLKLHPEAVELTRTLGHNDLP